MKYMSPWRPCRFTPGLAVNYLKTAWRKIWRQKGYSLINIAGLAIGLAVSMMIMLWVIDELGFDRFHVNAGKIFRVYRDETATQLNAASALTSPPIAASLKKDFPEVLKATRFGAWGAARLISFGDKSFTERKYMHADSDFFSMFSFPFVKGDPGTAFANPFSIVLTETAAAKYFGRENPMGKTLTIDRTFDVVVTGVLRDLPPGSSLEFDCLSPFEVVIQKFIGEDNRDSWGFNSFSTFVMLKSERSGEDLSRKLAGYIQKFDPEDKDRLSLQPLTDIHLFSRLGHDYRNRGDIKYVWIFSALAVFVLAIAGVNFMNLATARSANRAREVGLRKVVGARRSQLIGQFFGESVLMALLALVAALILVELSLPLFNTFSGKSLTSVWRTGPLLLAGFLGLALVTGVFSGSYPALYLSSFQPIRVLRGSLRSAGASSLFRKSLVIFQFSLSAFLIIGTGVISRQLTYLRAKDLGFNRERVVRLGLYGELVGKYASIRERFLQNPDVLRITASLSLPTDIQNSPGTPEWEGKAPDAVMEIKADFVDYDYIETFGVPLVEGRSFSREFATDAESAFIVNEEAVKRMGLKRPAVGKMFGFWNIKGLIIGVMKDAHFQALQHKIEPMVFKIYPSWFRFMYIKIRAGDVSTILRSLEKTWAGMSLGYPFEARFLDDDFDGLYRTEARLGGIFRTFAALAVFIACLGLLGLAAFVAEQRTREIAIRKVLGASVSGITAMMSREFTIWVLTANLVAWPVAWLVMKRWLGGFAYRTDIGWWIFLVSAGLSLGLAILTVSYQSLRAARSNPAQTMRQDT